MRGNATRGFTLAFGEFGLKAQGRGWLTARQIEAARKAISRYAQRGECGWDRVRGILLTMWQSLRPDGLFSKLPESRPKLPKLLLPEPALNYLLMLNLSVRIKYENK